MRHFRDGGHEAGRLNDLVVVVIPRCKHGWTGVRKQDTTLAQGPILGAIGWMRRGVPMSLVKLFLAFGSKPWNSAIRGIHYQRCPPGVHAVAAAVKPSAIIGAASQVAGATRAIVDALYIS